MIALLAKGLLSLGVPQKLARPLVIGILAALAAFILWRLWDGHGDRRYAEGVAATDAKWEAASAKLKEQAAQSATKADDAAAKRLDEYVQQANEDAAAVEKAKADGSSPLDALFGG